ncbi:hypothetical protein Misp01_42060 [Microtetraspora sp. NBRC 13810]|uniref:hypothetical protein n=1 Tax=Microtetraspora sp. NBRC 13810 TaxID=3030990 RepID=UPI0025539DFE|nr:hypothetical protein [Microtetraspora sp. NBRC 13810]GLW09077.1 hypothetical protein Misp01_42060 [Microtetraspora sp. NBRC 13810]
MDPDTLGGDLGGATSDVYWRRRMALLVSVLVVVAVVAWACSSTSSPQGRTHLPVGLASGSPTPDPLLASLQRKPTPTPAPPARPKPRVTPSAAPTVSAPPRRAGDACPPADLVLGLQGQQEVYAGGLRPRFTLTLVNTGRLMCTADVGPRALEIRITSGQDRIWSSADCISGDGVEIRRLQRGIPYVAPFEWDRHRSASSCGATRADARPGTYVATVRTGHLRSPKAVFHLR